MGARQRGRPRLSSAATLAEAAAELFLERGYDATTVDDIASRAGVSRGTFFGYLPQKSDCLWIDLDAALARVEPTADAPAVRAAADALERAVAPWGAAVPWVLRDASVIGATAALAETAAARIQPVAARIAQTIAAAEGEDAAAARPRSIAGALVGATIGAVLAWAAAGASRGEASRAVHDALAPLVVALAAESS